MGTDLLEKPKVDTAKFEGKVLNWDFEGSRKCISGVMRYGRLRKFMKAEIFSIESGEGEQRDLINRRVNHLVKVIKAGKYVPTTFSLGTRQNHRDALEFTEDGKKVSLILELGDTLPLLNANHRFAAMERIRQEGGKTALAIDNQYIIYTLYLDGDTKEDFIILNDGMPINKSHMMSIKIENGLVDKAHSDYYKFAMQTAKLLNTNTNGSFNGQIRFDSTSAKVPLTITTLLNKKATDLIFSLYGGAKIALQHKKDAEWLANIIDSIYHNLSATDEGMELFAKGKLLQPAPDGANIGSYYLIALGNALAARCLLKDIDEPDSDDLELLLESALNNLDLEAKNHTVGVHKYKPFHNFAQDFFADLEPSMEEMDAVNDSEETDISQKMLAFHFGIPVILIKCLSASTFGIDDLPKVKKPRKGKATSGIKIEVKDSDLPDEEPVKISVHVDDPEFDFDEE